MHVFILISCEEMKGRLHALMKQPWAIEEVRKPCNYSAYGTWGGVRHVQKESRQGGAGARGSGEMQRQQKN